MNALLLTLAAVLPPPMPDLPPVVDLDPNPPAMCVVCKGTKIIKQGNGNDVPCPECTTQLAMADTKKHGCDCESGGPCTCNGDCDCAECACEDCPGKTSYDVLLPVCDASGCRTVRTKATRKGKLWYAENAGQWHIWKSGKWKKIAPAGDGSYRIERPIFPIVSDPLNGYVQIGRLGKPALTYARRTGQHSHRCGVRGCGHVWSHYPGQSHRCPSCGGLTSQNYVQINSGRTYQRPVMRQPRRMFASRGG